MTDKPLSVTQKQVTAILKGAARAGVKLEIKAVNGAVYFNRIDDQKQPEAAPDDREKRPILISEGKK